MKNISRQKMREKTQTRRREREKLQKGKLFTSDKKKLRKRSRKIKKTKRKILEIGSKCGFLLRKRQSRRQEEMKHG